MEYHEELSIAEMGEDVFDKFKIDPENKYAISHHIYGSSFITDPGIVEIGLSYQELVGYLKGATLGKEANQDIFLYNGISSVARNGLFPGVDFYSLHGKDLEEILKLTNLDRKFGDKVRRV